MKSISPNRVSQWETVGELWYPVAISTECPKCNQLGVFPAEMPTANPYAATVAFVGKCPRCNLKVAFAAMGCKIDAGAEPRCDWIAMHPSVSDKHTRLDCFDVFTPDERLDELYRFAKSAFRIGDYGGCAANCRKLLEGVAKHFGRDSNESLKMRIKDLPLVVELNELTSRLADLLRECGNIGAHFDKENEVTEEQASYSLILTEYLVDYLFILPAHMDALADYLGLNPPEDAANQE